MQKITLPLVMIASLATLVSCGQTTVNTTPPRPVAPVVTGVVVTPTTPVVPAAPVGTGITPAPITTVNPVRPEVFTRSETVSYTTPAGTDLVGFSVTVTDGIVTAASATPKAENEISLKRQTAFAAEVSKQVVGKKAKDLNIDAIGGSSLTSGAFETFVRSF
jgi:hypothetical protein